MDFNSILSVEERKEILLQRLRGFYIEAYQVSLHIKVAEATNDQESLKQTEESLKILEAAIKVYSEELESL